MKTELVARKNNLSVNHFKAFCSIASVQKAFTSNQEEVNSWCAESLISFYKNRLWFCALEYIKAIGLIAVSAYTDNRGVWIKLDNSTIINESCFTQVDGNSALIAFKDFDNEQIVGEKMKAILMNETGSV